MKTILKTALFLCLPLIFTSCDNDNESLGNNQTELSSKMQSKNGELSRGETPKELYNEVVDATDQFAVYNSLNFREKSMVWQGKLDDFIANSDLNTGELDFVNILKSKLSEEFFENIDKNYDTDDIKLLEMKARQIFGTARGLSLFYSMETVYKNGTPEAQKNCFWCNNIVVAGSEGPCHIQYFNGVPQYVQTVDVVKVRFWITVQTFETVQACNP